MAEDIIRIIEEHTVNGIIFQIAETRYEFGRHYVLISNGIPGFHSTDLDRVQDYMHSITGLKQ